MTEPDYEEVRSIRQYQRRLTALEIADVVARYQAGQQMAALAREYGCARQTISWYLRGAGLSAPDTSFTAEKVDEMVKLYRSGLSLARVSEQIGASPTTIRKYLNCRGVAMRDNHGQATCQDLS